RGLCLVATARADRDVVVRDLLEPRPLRVRPGGDATGGPGWSVYPRAVVARLERAFPAARAGADIAFASDLPPASGLSSSSALVTALLLALATLRGLPREPAFRERVGSMEALAELAAAVETGAAFRDLPGDAGVGVRGGSEDHTAILCARAGHVSQYAFAPVRREREVALPAGWSFLVASSGVTAEKTGAARDAYNRASDDARTLLRLWREAAGADAPHLAAALAADPDAVSRLRALPAARALLPRLEQFAEESGTLVPAAADALAAGDMDGVGRLARRSMELAERALGNQVPETLHLTRSALAAGAAAASAFGAGFGGSVWALAPERAAGEVLASWRGDYLRHFPERAAGATFFTTPCASPATRAR
ncbi:MAG TPA: hypothetical protein VMK65_11145, partial [Longimicrobiales bacterium]|nr:hypothetical protein [Longimicrobiales bacterium]